jgi:hypothetical protein
MEIKDLFREVKYPIQLFDKNGKEIYWECSEGRWFKKEYDEKGNHIYTENSNGYWCKLKYDKNNKCVYCEDSYQGVTFDNRPKPNKVITINGIDIELTNETINKLKEALEN